MVDEQPEANQQELRKGLDRAADDGWPNAGGRAGSTNHAEQARRAIQLLRLARRPTRQRVRARDDRPAHRQRALAGRTDRLTGRHDRGSPTFCSPISNERRDATAKSSWSLWALRPANTFPTNAILETDC